MGCGGGSGSTAAPSSVKGKVTVHAGCKSLGPVLFPMGERARDLASAPREIGLSAGGDPNFLERFSDAF